MPYAADYGRGVAHLRFAMRPRRWYTQEVAPPTLRAIKLTARLWRYHSLVRQKRYDDAPYHTATFRQRRYRRIIHA
jgi:hypothetical protein